MLLLLDEPGGPAERHCALGDVERGVREGDGGLAGVPGGDRSAADHEEFDVEPDPAVHLDRAWADLLGSSGTLKVAQVIAAPGPEASRTLGVGGGTGSRDFDGFDELG